MPGDPFRIDSPSIAPARRAALTAARPFLSWLLRLRTYRGLYEQTKTLIDRPFESRVLDALQIQVSLAHDEMSCIATWDVKAPDGSSPGTASRRVTLRDWSKGMDDSVERVFHIKE